MTSDPHELLARIGPFFRFERLDGRAWARLDADDARAVVSAEIDRVHGAMTRQAGGADVERRTAAASVHLMAVSRLVGPALALVSVTGNVPDLRPASVAWRGDEQGLTYASDLDLHDVDGDVVDAVTAYVLPGTDRITELVDDVVRLGGSVTGSNVASTIGSCRNTLALTSPELGRAASRLVRPLIEGTSLREHVEIRPDGSLRRRGCCLFYRAPHGGLCGDCVLAAG